MEAQNFAVGRGIQEVRRISPQNPGLMGKMLATAFLQLLAFYSIPYFIYQSLGLSGFHWLTITSIQAVLYISVSALPLPGAVGVTEGGFCGTVQQHLSGQRHGMRYDSKPFRQLLPRRDRKRNRRICRRNRRPVRAGEKNHRR